MKLKKENPKSRMRTELLKVTMDRDLSTSTQLAIADGIRYMTDEQKEESCSQMLTIINSLQTEEEIVEVLTEQGFILPKE